MCEILAPTMASMFLITVVVLLVAAAPLSVHSWNCTDEGGFPSYLDSNIIAYTDCRNLPTLDASLHWAFNQSSSTLSFAFTAPPPNVDGWISWAVNPHGHGMLGAQAFVASKQPSSLLVLSVKTYRLNTTNNATIEESELDYSVWDVGAISWHSMARDTWIIYGTIQVPPHHLDSLYQVWQVGSSMSNGHPMMHELKPDNRLSCAPLNITHKPDSSEPSKHGSLKIGKICIDIIVGVVGVVFTVICRVLIFWCWKKIRPQPDTPPPQQGQTTLPTGKDLIQLDTPPPQQGQATLPTRKDLTQQGQTTLTTWKDLSKQAANAAVDPVEEHISESLFDTISVGY